MAGGAVRVMNEVREAYGVVIPPFCRCAAAAILANCDVPAPGSVSMNKSYWSSQTEPS